MLPSHATLRLEWHGTGHHPATHSETIQPPRSAARSLAEIGGTRAGLELRWGRHHLRWGCVGVEETGGANPNRTALRRLLHRLPGVVRARGNKIHFRAGADRAVEETDRAGDGASREAIRRNQSARP